MDALNGLIHLKYDPTRGAGLLATPPRSADREYLGWNRALERGQVLLDAAFESAVADVPTDDHHVVALSGGLDSRAVLAGMLDHLPSDRITAVTVGTPGTWDFEFGRAVAETAGITHERFPITEADWSVAALEQTVKGELASTGRDALLGQWFGMNAFYQAMRGRYPDETTYWHGFLGDPLAGERIASNPASSWEEACLSFCERTAAVDEQFATPAAARSLLPDAPFIPADRMSFDQQLDLGVRQPCFIRPIDLSDTVYPFDDDDLATFLLGLPDEWRRDRLWFKQLVQRWKPELFALPTTSANGARLSDPWVVQRLRAAASWAVHDTKRALGREPTHPNNMYWNWNTAFRNPDRLKPAGKKLLHSLAARELPIKIDPIAVFDRHQGGEDFANTIRSLGSFELYCRTVQELDEPRSAAIPADVLS